MEASPLSSLRWTLKRSLLDYVESSGGSAHCKAGAKRTAIGFQFPQSLVPATSELPALFLGSVVIEAYGGLLSFVIASPAIEELEEGLVLTVDGLPGHGQRIVLAHLQDLVRADFDGQTRPLAATPVLTAAGADFFGGFYATGTSLDSLFVEKEALS